MINKCSDIRIASIYNRHLFDIPEFVDDSIEDDVRLTYDTKGNCIYTKVGDFNVSDYVNSFKDGCSLSTILQRINLLPVNEKVGYLKQVDSVDGDFTNIPSDLTDFMLKYQDLYIQFPDLFNRCANGETIDDVLKDYFKPNMEVNDNGSSESSSD